MPDGPSEFYPRSASEPWLPDLEPIAVGANTATFLVRRRDPDPAPANDPCPRPPTTGSLSDEAVFRISFTLPGEDDGTDPSIRFRIVPLGDGDRAPDDRACAPPHRNNT